MDKRYEYYKEQYFFELNRKEQLSSRLSIPIGFMTAILSAYAYFGVSLFSIYGHWSLWVFCFFILGSLIFSSRAGYYLFKSFVGLKYGYNPPSKNLYEYELKCKDNPKLDDIFFRGIKESYVNTTTKNRNNNNQRAESLYRTSLNTIYSIIFIILAAIPFFIGKSLNEYNNQKSPKPLSAMTTNDENNRQSSDDDEPINPETPPFPSDEWVTEGLDYDFPREIPDSIPPIERKGDDD
ncbi:MAG: hypothetical protein RBT74_16690 [Tenuifilaceae bacterium]|jgi:hypothetical protein|nr:hypothetical protein [Tenuifilaceae bacterium]